MTSGPESSHSHKRRILKNTVANGLAQAATMLSTLIFLPLLVHAFGVSVYGVMVLATSIAGYALLLDLGVSATLVRMVAERTATGDEHGVSSAIFSAATIYGVLGVFVAVVMLALALAAGAIFNVTAAELGLLRTLLYIGAAQQLWYWPTTAARDALSGLQRYDLVAGVGLFLVACEIGGSVLVLLTGNGPVVLVMVRVAAMVVGSLVYMTMLYRLLPGAARRVRASATDAREILRSGSSVFVLQIAQVMSRQQTDRLVLGIFVGTAAVTLYEIAAKLNSLITTFTGLTASAILPVAAELNARGEHATIRALFLRGTKIIATLVAPMTAILIAIAAPFIAAWVGPGMEDAVLVAQVLLVSQALLPLYQLGDNILIGKDRFSVWVPGGLTLALLNVVLSVILVQRFGLIGVAIGTLIAVLLESPWYMRVFGREIDLGSREWLAKTAWPTYPLLLLPAAIAWVGGTSPLGTSLVGLAAVAAVALACYWVVMWFAAYSAAERADLRSILHRHAPGTVTG